MIAEAQLSPPSHQICIGVAEQSHPAWAKGMGDAVLPLGNRVGPERKLHGGLLNGFFRGTYRCDLTGAKDLCRCDFRS